MTMKSKSRNSGDLVTDVVGRLRDHAELDDIDHNICEDCELAASLIEDLTDKVRDYLARLDVAMDFSPAILPCTSCGKYYPSGYVCFYCGKDNSVHDE